VCGCLILRLLHRDNCRRNHESSPYARSVDLIDRAGSKQRRRAAPRANSQRKLQGEIG
jgi:hypothetical protein